MDGSCHVGWAKRSVPTAAWHGTDLGPARDRHYRCAGRASPTCVRLCPSCESASHQILLGHGGAESVVVGDEAADELVQPVLEDLVHAAVLQAGADGACLALG